jgi:drug/metabolite transporter (DMT)-like permease
MSDDHAEPLRRALQTPWNATTKDDVLHHDSRSPTADFLWECYENFPWVSFQTAQDEAPGAASELISRDAEPYVPSHLGFAGRLAQFSPVAIVLVIGGSKLQSVLARRLTQGESVDAVRLLEIVMSLSLYLVSGPAVILVNKYIMKHYMFHFPIVLASLGNIFLMLVTRGAVLLGIKQVDRESMGWKPYFSVVVPINLCNFATQVTGMYAYLYISVPEIQILKSFTIVFVLFFAWLVAKERVNQLLATSVVVITMGVCLSALYGSGAGVGTQSGHAALIGFWLSMVASSTEALKSVISQIMMAKLSLFDGIYWASPSFVLLALVFISAIELRGLLHFDWSWPLVLTLILNAFLTGLIVVSTFWFVKLAGALTLKVITQARSIGLILFAVFFCGENCVGAQYTGYAVSLIGMGMFDHAKQQIKETVMKEAQGKHQAAK